MSQHQIHPSATSNYTSNPQHLCVVGIFSPHPALYSSRQVLGTTNLRPRPVRNIRDFLAAPIYIQSGVLPLIANSSAAQLPVCSVPTYLAPSISFKTIAGIRSKSWFPVFAITTSNYNQLHFVKHFLRAFLLLFIPFTYSYASFIRPHLFHLFGIFTELRFCLREKAYRGRKHVDANG